jgi:hypothetical protein
MVRVGRGELTARCAEEFRTIVGCLSLDSDLDIAAAITVLLHTLCDTLQRFEVFLKWPYKIRRLVCQWND